MMKIYLRYKKLLQIFAKKSHSICWQCQWTQSLTEWRRREKLTTFSFYFVTFHLVSPSLLTFLSKFSCFGSREFFFSFNFLALFQFKIQPLPPKSQASVATYIVLKSGLRNEKSGWKSCEVASNWQWTFVSIVFYFISSTLIKFIINDF